VQSCSIEGAQEITLHGVFEFFILQGCSSPKKKVCAFLLVWDGASSVVVASMVP
jgi:hypothetical protein